jgi:spermidine synthase
LKPGPLYALLEAAIGLWALATILLVPWANRLVATLTGPSPSALHHWAVAFAVPLLVLLPATAAMGATLPTLTRLAARAGEVERPVARLYAANTFGAMAGTLLSTFLLVPRLGQAAALGLFALVNFACAAAALLLGREAGPAAPAASRAPPASTTSGVLVGTLFLTGLLGIGYEVLVVRVLAQVQENTVYSFAGALVVYLAGTAAGAALHHRLSGRLAGRHPFPLLLTSVATLCLAGAATLWQAERLHRFLSTALGPGLGASIAAEMLLAAAAFLLPTLAMGATFSHLAEEARTQRLGLGGALAVNTLGAALAPLLFGVVALPLAGPRLSLLACAAAYLLPIPLREPRRYLPALLPAGAALALLLGAGPLRLVTLDPGEEVVAHVDGVMAAVTIVHDGRGDFHLKVNNHFQMGGTTSAYSDLRQGHLPLLWHPAPRRALYLGLGTAATFAAAADHPGLRAEGVELVPEIVPLLHHFQKSTGDLSANPELSILVADARRYVTATEGRYDVVVADLFHPARDGAASLYTREHFRAVRARLAEGGLFCQWLPLYQLDLETLRLVLRTFLDVFPDGSAHLAHFSLRAPIIGLVGGAAGRTWPPGWFEARVRDGALRERLGRLRLQDDLGLLGGYLAGGEALRRFAGDGPLNTDDRPLVAYQAPRFAYAPAEPAHERLLALLGALAPAPEEVLGAASTEEGRAAARRLAAYWGARDQFLRAGVGVRETSDPRLLLAQVRGPLLDVVRRSPDFDPAYQPLLGLATRLHAVDPAAAALLLGDLEQASPGRGEARALARRLAAGP